MENLFDKNSIRGKDWFRIDGKRRYDFIFREYRFEKSTLYEGWGEGDLRIYHGYITRYRQRLLKIDYAADPRLFEKGYEGGYGAFSETSYPKRSYYGLTKNICKVRRAAMDVPDPIFLRYVDRFFEWPSCFQYPSNKKQTRSRCAFESRGEIALVKIKEIGSGLHK